MTAEQEARGIIVGLNIDAAHREALVSLIAAALQRRDDELVLYRVLGDPQYLRDLKTQHEAALEQIERLRDGCAFSEERANRLAAEFREDVERNKAMSANNQLAALKAQHEADATEIMRLQDELSEARGSLAEWQRVLDERAELYQQEVDGLRVQLAEAQREIERLRWDLDVWIKRQPTVG